MELARQGKLKPRVWREYPLERAGEALQAVSDRAVIGKVVIVSQACAGPGTTLYATAANGCVMGSSL